MASTPSEEQRQQLVEAARVQNQRDEALVKAIMENDKKALAFVGGRVSQVYFDQVVEENVLLFELSVQDAIHETLEQFRKQGVPVEGLLVNPERFAAAVAEPPPSQSGS
jgi:hypothetical protein